MRTQRLRSTLIIEAVAFAFVVLILLSIAPQYAHSTKAFTFFDQTFQVPDSWPSEKEMANFPRKKRVNGNLTEYAFIQEMPPGAIVYWFVGKEIDSGFTTKLLTQTWFLPGYGTVGCGHWEINPDGTIKELSCEEFGKLTEWFKSSKSLT